MRMKTALRIFKSKKQNAHLLLMENIMLWLKCKVFVWNETLIYAGVQIGLSIKINNVSFIDVELVKRTRVIQVTIIRPDVTNINELIMYGIITVLLYLCETRNLYYNFKRNSFP